MTRDEFDAIADDDNPECRDPHLDGTTFEDADRALADRRFASWERGHA